jgi:GNAT superfamily N-acetyltransferase
MPAVVVRPGTPDDAERIVRYIRELAAYEKADPDELRVTPDDLRRYAFGPERCCETLIAELDGTPVGFALYFTNFSTWEGRPGLYVEDIYIEQSARGHGVGLALFRELADVAVARDCRRIDFWVLHWNPARDFYHRIGAVHMEDWLPYRIEGDALERLATV